MSLNDNEVIDWSQNLATIFTTSVNISTPKNAPSHLKYIFLSNLELMGYIIAESQNYTNSE